MTPTPSAPEVSVVVIDDHDVIHSGIQAWCDDAEPPIRVTASYLDAEAFLSAGPPPAPETQVVVLDLELTERKPDFAALERITRAGHRVVVYSHLEHTEIILTCLDLGAVSYLVKSEGRNHLIEAITAAATDTPYVGPRMAGALSSDRSTGRPSLSPREKEVLIAWFQTESKDLVGSRLYIAPGTVRTLLQRARVKYASVGRAAPTKSALVARAIQDGLISIDDL